MSNPAQRPVFVRIEGYFDPETIAGLRGAVEDTESKTVQFEELPVRDYDEQGRLLDKLPEVGLMVTKGVLTAFSKRWQYNAQVMYGRAANAFDALHRHVRDGHAPEAQTCDCCLRGGQVWGYSPQRRMNNHRYVEPLSLVTAYEAGSLKSIPIGSGPSSKGLGEAACYDLIGRYVEALTS